MGVPVSGVDGHQRRTAVPAGAASGWPDRLEGSERPADALELTSAPANERRARRFDHWTARDGIGLYEQLVDQFMPIEP